MERNVMKELDRIAKGAFPAAGGAGRGYARWKRRGAVVYYGYADGGGGIRRRIR
ncbi:MAG: hypothetical protein WCP22_05865 [Chlamydiota bacterium]